MDNLISIEIINVRFNIIMFYGCEYIVEFVTNERLLTL